MLEMFYDKKNSSFKYKIASLKNKRIIYMYLNCTHKPKKHSVRSAFSLYNYTTRYGVLLTSLQFTDSLYFYIDLFELLWYTASALRHNKLNLRHCIPVFTPVYASELE